MHTASKQVTPKSAVSFEQRPYEVGQRDSHDNHKTRGFKRHELTLPFILGGRKTYNGIITLVTTHMNCWSHRPRDVGGGIGAVHLLGLRVRIPPGHGCLSVVTVVCCRVEVDSSSNVMAHGDTREGKWRENWRMEWVASTLHTTSEHGVSNITTITTADAHTSAASSRLNWRPNRFKWTRPFRRKTKSCFCACAFTFQLASICDGPITRPEQSYRLCGGWVWSRNLKNEQDLAH